MMVLTEEQQQRARKILEQVAQADVNHMTVHFHEGRIYACHYCTMPNYVTHTEDCPVTQARLLVNEVLR